MMKESTSPRKIYTRNGVTHVCFAGFYFGPGKTAESAINTDKLIKCELSEDGKLLTVTQRVGNKKPIVETWGKVKVPRKAREAA